ncbi:MAG TPA: FN3 associated domain-containing protein [Pirellulales bacterium]|nr:FN3 associated domain-containing protein [Pirellulales bacterium]
MLWAVFSLAADAAERKSVVCDGVRFQPMRGHEQAMVGGKFTGSNTAADRGYVVLAEIIQAPPAGKWTKLKFANDRPYRWIRYEGPPGSFGRVMKIEFFAGDKRIEGQVIAPFSRREWMRVVNDEPTKGAQGLKPDDQYVGLDLGERAACARPSISPGGAIFDGSLTMTLRSNTPGATIRYTTDGTLPTESNGMVYSQPVQFTRTTSVTAVAFVDGRGPSPAVDAVYVAEPAPNRNTLHFGNSLTGNALGRFELYLRSAGVVHTTKELLMGGGLTYSLWNSAIVPPGDPSDTTRWRELYSTDHSLDGKAAYAPEQVAKCANDWRTIWSSVEKISDVTFQPRDADVTEEAAYTLRWLNVVREKFPDVQPWLYIEWTERARQRATDLGTQPSRAMKKTYPALTWEESMAAMMLYGEEVRDAIAEQDRGAKRARIIPVAVAMGMIHRQIEDGAFPGAAADDFYPLLYSDHVHVSGEGSYLVDLVWYAAMYGQSPEGKLLPLRLNLSTEQAASMQRLAWEVVKNYPDCGLDEEGSQPVAAPQFTPDKRTVEGATRLSITSATHGTWFRYTLDGSQPSRTHGYIYCGAVCVPPGVTIKAIAYKSGSADSGVAEYVGGQDSGIGIRGKQ